MSAPCGRDGRGRELPLHGVGPVDDPLADGHAAVLLLRRPRSVDLRLGHTVGNVPEIPRPGTKILLGMKFAQLSKQLALLILKVFKYSSLMLNQPHGRILVAAYLCNAISW